MFIHIGEKSENIYQLLLVKLNWKGTKKVVGTVMLVKTGDLVSGSTRYSFREFLC